MSRQALLDYLTDVESETFALASLPRPPDPGQWRALIERELQVASLSPGIYDVLTVKLAARRSAKPTASHLQEVDLGSARFLRVNCSCGETAWIQVLKTASCPKCSKRFKATPHGVIRWNSKTGTFAEETSA